MPINSYTHSALLALLFLLAGLPSPLLSENLHFYIVGKSQADANFRLALDGCNSEAIKNNDQCHLVGPETLAQPREQLTAIEYVLDSLPADGMAISVINSHLIKSAIQSAHIPVITFDSPFVTAESPLLVQTHIGVDDIVVGRKLAELAKEDFPKGGTVCIMTDDDPNLDLRVQGIRLELSNEQKATKLRDTNGWREPERCPWLTSDDENRVKQQLIYTFETLQPDVIISVGHWPVYFPKAIDFVTKKYLDRLRKGQPYLYSGIGNLSPEYQHLLNIGYVHGFVEIDFHQQGRLIYQTLYDRVKGEQSLPRLITSDVLVTHRHEQNDIYEAP